MVDDQLKWNKYRIANARCNNCTSIDLQSVFCDDVQCNFFDPKTLFAYICDTAHNSIYGLRKLMPLIKNAIDDVFYRNY